MRGLFFQDGLCRYREDLPTPDAADECLVRVVKAGVCATDLALLRGYMGFRGVPGHEFVGVALTGPLKGARVVGEINASCGQCDACASPHVGPRHCPRRTVLGILGRAGCFAERISLPSANLQPVPTTISDDAAVFTEPVAAALAIKEQVAYERGQRALVVGDGRLGLLCANVLALDGLEVTLAGRHPAHAELLVPGVTHVTGLVEEHGRPAERGYDLAVEATGNPQLLARVCEFVRPRGTVVIKTTSEKRAELDLAPIVVNELTLVGSRCGRFEPALVLLASGRLPVERMIAARYPLADGAAALEHASRPGTLKVIIEIGRV
ncbi:MAG: alcohol dehydrogenase catalytic domain-containing protein [Planctomycetota bacterium]